VGQGSGLGLSQVFGFIKQSKGHVKIYSELAHGTCVKVYLPRYLGTETHTARKAGLQTLMSVAALQELGYKTIAATNGEEALAVIENVPGVDLLFTDIVMADMSGRQLADAVFPIRSKCSTQRGIHAMLLSTMA